MLAWGQRRYPIGLLTDRGIGLAVGALGILKAGAAYVPIDATFPEKRVAFILSDTAAPAVVTRSVFTDRLTGYSGRVICMDTATPDEIGNASAGGVAASVTPEGLAYIVYTSGSTGAPKGVMISHRALVNHATAISSAYELCAADRICRLLLLRSMWRRGDFSFLAVRSNSRGMARYWSSGLFGSAGLRGQPPPHRLEPSRFLLARVGDGTCDVAAAGKSATGDSRQRTHDCCAIERLGAAYGRANPPDQCLWT